MMTVAFSESDISKIAVGQPATVSLDALAGVELAAHVTQISTVGLTSSERRHLQRDPHSSTSATRRSSRG